MYAYAANNPVHYIDPDGNDIHTVSFFGVGVKLILGGDVSVGISWDDNGNIALALMGGLGIGVEAEVDLPIAPSYSVSKDTNINELPGIGAFKFDGTASATGVETNVGAVIGINMDLESTDISGFNTGIIGGGVTFISGTMYITLKNGYKDLIKQYEKLDQKQKELILTEIKTSDVIPEEIKKEFINAVTQEQE